MCGILAILRFDGKNSSRELVERMRDAMYHRGPDDAGIYLAPPAALAHRRLSIIDLTGAGRQPMTNEDGSLVIVFNGEIYNYLELKQELEQRGHRFHSTSDTEVILHQYEEDGERCLDKLNGMFSFVLWDTRQKRLFAARDRLGIKPLHIYRDDKQIILASEIKAILEDPAVPRETDPEGIADFFFAGYTLGSKTLFQRHPAARARPPDDLRRPLRPGRVSASTGTWRTGTTTGEPTRTSRPSSSPCSTTPSRSTAGATPPSAAI